MIVDPAVSPAPASNQTIVQVTLWNSHYLGNFMSTQLLLAREVATRLGMRTHMVLADGAQNQSWLADLDAGGVSWSILPSRRSAWGAHLRRAIEEHDGALVHTHFTAADLPSAKAAARAGIPCIWHIHTGFNGYPLTKRFTDLIKMRLVARGVARIITVSPWIAELTRRRGAPSDLIEVLPTPIDVARFRELPPREQARRELRVDSSASVLVGLGWWPDVKGVDIMLEAVSSLAQRHPELQLLLVGEDMMRAFIAGWPGGAPDWLRLSGFVADARVLFSAADVFISASRHEGQSFAVGEALASGKQVVMSDIPGTAGWRAAPDIAVFASQDAGALAASIESLIARDPDSRARGAEANRSWVASHAAPMPWCEHLCRTYAELLEG